MKKLSQLGRVKGLLRSSAEMILDCLLPYNENCGLCGRSIYLEPPYLCPKCKPLFKPIKSPCGKCGKPLLKPNLPCPYCNPQAEPYAQRFLTYTLNGAAKDLVHHYKYTGYRDLHRVLAALFVLQLKAQLGLEDKDLPMASPLMGLPLFPQVQNAKEKGALITVRILPKKQRKCYNCLIIRCLKD